MHVIYCHTWRGWRCGGNVTGWIEPEQTYKISYSYSNYHHTKHIHICCMKMHAYSIYLTCFFRVHTWFFMNVIFIRNRCFSIPDVFFVCFIIIPYIFYFTFQIHGVLVCASGFDYFLGFCFCFLRFLLFFPHSFRFYVIFLVESYCNFVYK